MCRGENRSDNKREVCAKPSTRRERRMAKKKLEQVVPRQVVNFHFSLIIFAKGIRGGSSQQLMHYLRKATRKSLRRRLYSLFYR